VNLRFRTAFWEELEAGRYRDAGFFHRPRLPSDFWTALPMRAPLLVAWPASEGRRMSGARRQNIIRHAVASLNSVFGVGSTLSHSSNGSIFHDWQRDPYACGAYAWVKGRRRRRAQGAGGAAEEYALFAAKRRISKAKRAR